MTSKGIAPIVHRVEAIYEKGIKILPKDLFPFPELSVFSQVTIAIITNQNQKCILLYFSKLEAIDTL